LPEPDLVTFLAVTPGLTRSLANVRFTLGIILERLQRLRVEPGVKKELHCLLS
jgi:hypothetical protein